MLREQLFGQTNIFLLFSSALSLLCCGGGGRGSGRRRGEREGEREAGEGEAVGLAEAIGWRAFFIHGKLKCVAGKFSSSTVIEKITILA